jgi:uncharacterized RDD family membrane protein YckC
MATTSAETLNSGRFCSECGRPFPSENLARFGENMVCGDCKPRFVQRLREGVPASMAVVYGGFWRRVVAVLIDAFILMIVMFPLEMAFGLFSAPRAGNRSFAAGYAMGYLGLIWLLSTVLNLTYYTYFLSQKGATPGKMVMGLKVIVANGDRIGVGRAIARYFAHVLSGLTLGIGYIMVAFDSQKRGLHDYICSTRVIRQA